MCIIINDKYILYKVFLSINSNTGRIKIPENKTQRIDEIRISEYLIKGAATAPNIFIVCFKQIKGTTIHATQSIDPSKADIEGFPLGYVHDTSSAGAHHVLYDKPRIIDNKNITDFKFVQFKIKNMDGTPVPNTDFDNIHLWLEFICERTDLPSHNQWQQKLANLHAGDLDIHYQGRKVMNHVQRPLNRDNVRLDMDAQINQYKHDF